MRRFAKDELDDVEVVIRSYPFWPKGKWAVKVGTWLMEWTLPGEWWEQRDESRRQQGLPL